MQSYQFLLNFRENLIRRQTFSLWSFYSSDWLWNYSFSSTHICLLLLKKCEFLFYYWNLILKAAKFEFAKRLWNFRNRNCSWNSTGRLNELSRCNNLINIINRGSERSYLCANDKNTNVYGWRINWYQLRYSRNHIDQLHKFNITICRSNKHYNAIDIILLNLF